MTKKDKVWTSSGPKDSDDLCCPPPPFSRAGGASAWPTRTSHNIGASADPCRRPLRSWVNSGSARPLPDGQWAHCMVLHTNGQSCR